MWQMINSVTLDFACLRLSMMSFSLAMEKKNTEVTLSLTGQQF